MSDDAEIARVFAEGLHADAAHRHKEAMDAGRFADAERWYQLLTALEACYPEHLKTAAAISDKWLSKG